MLPVRLSSPLVEASGIGVIPVSLGPKPTVSNVLPNLEAELKDVRPQHDMGSSSSGPIATSGVAVVPPWS